MKKIKKLLIIFVVIIIVGFYLFFTKDNNTYYNISYGYSVSYSDNWSVDEGRASFNTVRDNVYFRPINRQKDGDYNWVEIYARPGGNNKSYHTSDRCGSATEVMISGHKAIREICKGGGGGIESVDYYVTDKRGTDFIISVLYSQSQDPKIDPLVPTIKLDLPVTDKIVPIPNQLITVKGELDIASHSFSLTELNSENNTRLDCIRKGECLPYPVDSSPVFDGRRFNLKFTASSTCSRQKLKDSRVTRDFIPCESGLEKGDRVTVFGLLNNNFITVDGIEDYMDMPVSDWLNN